MKKAVLLVLASALACHDNPTQPAPPVASLVVVTAPQSIITVSSSVQLAATVYDAQGKAITGASVSWQSLQPQVASVSASGLVTGVSVGTAVIRATSGTHAGEATLTVDPDPCTSPLNLTVGQVRQLSGPAAVACVSLAATTGASDFLFVTANASQTLDDLGLYAVNLSQSSGSTNVAAALQQSTLSALVAPQTDFAGVIEANIRQQERALTPHFSAFRRNGALLSVTPGAPSLAAAPTEGSTVTYRVPNVNAGSLCTTYTEIQAVVKKVSQHAVIVQDASAPANGFTQADFDAIAAEWENLVFPTDTVYFGGPTDRNADGHITILYTGEVNRATPSGASGFIAGFFWGGDLVKKSEYAAFNPPVSCPQTNEQEIMYMLVPDPAGTINGNVRTVTSVRQNTRGTVAHEFQHMINQGLRLLNPAVDSSETVWLNEALSHVAEEIVGRTIRGYSDFQGLGASDVTINVDDYNAFFVQNLRRLRPWMQRPDTSSPTSNRAASQLAPRGAGWMFLRYVIDQYSNNNAKAFLRHVVAGPDIGLRNLVQWSGGGQFDDMLRGFLVSQFTDEFAVSNLSSLYTVRSWKVRDVMASVNGGVFPLLVTTLPANVTTQSLAGSGNFFRLTRLLSSPVTTFRMTSSGGSPVPFPGARVYVVRLQ